MEYSIQLYSVRDMAQKDFDKTIEDVAKLGYKAVEFAGFYNRTPEQINELLSKNGLKVSGTHSSLDDLVNNYDETVKYHKAIGNKNYIIPGYDLSNQEKLDRFVKNVNEVSKRLEEDGISLGYHNHAHEFKLNADGSLIYEQILYRTDLFLEIDTYWAFVGMGEPVTLMNRLSDRLKFIHIKDGSRDGKGTPLGLGEAPVGDVYRTAKNMNIPMVVESETCTPDGLTEAKICIEHLFSLEK